MSGGSLGRTIVCQSTHLKMRLSCLPADWLSGLVTSDASHGHGESSSLETVMASKTIDELMLGARSRECTLVALASKVLEGICQILSLVCRVDR